MSEDKARAVGINHVALEVADIDAALDFYGRLFEFKLRGQGERSAFIDLERESLRRPRVYLIVAHSRFESPAAHGSLARFSLSSPAWTLEAECSHSYMD